MDHNREDLVNSARVRCPRCGYDQRGVLATWAESCPLQGVCSECGLDLEWSRVLQPEKYELQWCVEFVRRTSAMPRACVTTWLRSWLPWRFWSRIEMAHPPRWGRLASYVGFLALFVILAYVVVQGGAALAVRANLQWMAMSALPTLAQQIGLQQQTVDDLGTMLALPGFSAEQDKSVQSELKRAQAQLAAMKQASVATSWLSHSFSECLAEAIFFPWRSTSSCTVTMPIFRSSYVPPNELIQSAIYSTPFYQSRSSGFFLERSVLLLLLSLAIFALWPLALVMLPVSRRRAKIRWAHVWRVVIYGLFIPTAIITFAAMMLVICFTTASYDATLGWAFALLTRYGCAMLTMVWWWAAIRWYFRMPHAEAIAVLLTVMTALTVLGIAWLLIPAALVFALQ